MVKLGRKKPRRDLIGESLTKLAEYKFKTPDDVEALYLFRDGEYVLGESFVKGLLEATFGNETNTGLCGEVINHLKRRSYVPRGDFNQFNGEIPTQNGLLTLSTGEINPFTPDKIFTFKIQAKHDPDKRCDKWLKFLEEVMPNEEDRLALQEYAGYTLLPRMPYHKIAFLVGSGRNGKGVFTRTIQAIVGTANNVSNIRIDYLNGGHRFAATNLYGKLMNVSSEPSTRWPLQTELLKALTGEDWLDGEVKGKQNPIRFQPFAKHYVLANKLPRVSDTSLGWWDRVLITVWEQTFTEEKGNQITDMEFSWLDSEDDRSGILNWMIEGLSRLQKNGKFTKSKTQRDAMIQFKRASDPVAAFLVEECEYAPDHYILREPLYAAYKDYARSLNAVVEGTRVFWERVRNLPGVSVDKKKRIKNKAERVVLGLQLRNRDVEDTLDDYSGDDDQPEEPSEAPEAGEALHSTRGKTNNKNIKKEGVETHASSASSASLSSKTPLSDAVVKAAENLLNLNKNRMGQTDLFTQLEKTGYKRADADYILRSYPKRFEFIGFDVRLLNEGALVTSGDEEAED